MTPRPDHSAAAVRCQSCQRPANVTVDGLCFACIGRDLERQAPRAPTEIPPRSRP
jgi:hypothetical protein